MLPEVKRARPLSRDTHSLGDRFYLKLNYKVHKCACVRVCVSSDLNINKNSGEGEGTKFSNSTVINFSVFTWVEGGLWPKWQPCLVCGECWHSTTPVAHSLQTRNDQDQRCGASHFPSQFVLISSQFNKSNFSRTLPPTSPGNTPFARVDALLISFNGNMIQQLARHILIRCVDVLCKISQIKRTYSVDGL